MRVCDCCSRPVQEGGKLVEYSGNDICPLCLGFEQEVDRLMDRISKRDEALKSAHSMMSKLVAYSDNVVVAEAGRIEMSRLAEAWKDH